MVKNFVGVVRRCGGGGGSDPREELGCERYETMGRYVWDDAFRYESIGEDVDGGVAMKRRRRRRRIVEPQQNEMKDVTRDIVVAVNSGISGRRGVGECRRVRFHGNHEIGTNGGFDVGTFLRIHLVFSL